MPRYSDAYPEDDSSKSEWDARQIYARALEELDNSANEIKMRMESRNFPKEEVTTLFKTYLSLLRTMFRKMQFLYKEDKAKKIKEDIRRFTDYIDGELNKDIEDEKYPQQLENDMEELQNTLNKRRFERGLIIPMGPARDPTGAGGIPEGMEDEEDGEA
jgi:hypothetical protein